MRLEGKSLKSDFFKFIIPSIIAQLVFSLYTMVDGIFVARGVFLHYEKISERFCKSGMTCEISCFV